MKNGTISLYSMDDDRLIGEYVYYYPKERRKLIELWMKKYGENIKHCYFQINPSADPYKVKANGENHEMLRVKPEERKEPLVRPLSNYDNHTPYGIADELHNFKIK